MAPGISTSQAIQEGDYDLVGYNAGLLGGGYLAAGSGLGHKLVTSMGGKPSNAPRTLNPIRLCQYEWANRLGGWGQIAGVDRRTGN